MECDIHVNDKETSSTKKILWGTILSGFFYISILTFLIFAFNHILSTVFTFAVCFWSIPICRIFWIDTSPRGRSAQLIVRQTPEGTQWPYFSTMGAGCKAMIRWYEWCSTMSHFIRGNNIFRSSCSKFNWYVKASIAVTLFTVKTRDPGTNCLWYRDGNL